jgi:hypothetical protein
VKKKYKSLSAAGRVNCMGSENIADIFSAPCNGHLCRERRKRDGKLLENALIAV